MFRRCTLAIALLTGLTVPALADALDGDWCNAIDGKLTIDGSTIITPAGKSVEGNYSRHRFDYTPPEGDWNAGQPIVIQQYSHTLMKLSVGDQPAREWRPCQVIS